MGCGVVEIAAGVGLVWVRRDGVGAVAVVPGMAVVPLALSVLAVLVSLDVAVLSSTVPAVALVLAPSSALPVLLFEVPACSCCSAVTWGCVASAMAAMGIVALTMDVHAIAQSR